MEIELRSSERSVDALIGGEHTRTTEGQDMFPPTSLLNKQPTASRGRSSLVLTVRETRPRKREAGRLEAYIGESRYGQSQTRGRWVISVENCGTPAWTA